MLPWCFLVTAGQNRGLAIPRAHSEPAQLPKVCAAPRVTFLASGEKPLVSLSSSGVWRELGITGEKAGVFRRRGVGVGMREG